MRVFMPIAIDSKVEAKIRERAAAEGLSAEAYLERLVEADQAAEDELERLALEGLDSGDPVRLGPDYWQEKHTHLDQRLGRKSGTR
jgi:hypothetical protein